MAIAEIVETSTGRVETLTRNAWYLCPHVVGYKTVCGYYETRLDLFTFACDVAGIDPEGAQWVDGHTGEVLDFWELADEAYEYEYSED